MTELKDWRGTPIEVGSTIVYPGHRGSAYWVTEAEVTDIQWEPHKWRTFESSPKLTVERKLESYGYGVNGKGNPVAGKSIITAVGRVTVVNPRG